MLENWSLMSHVIAFKLKQVMCLGRWNTLNKMQDSDAVKVTFAHF